LKLFGEKEKNIKNLIISFLSSVAIILVSLFILAMIMHFFEIEKKYASSLSGVALGIGCFFGGLIYSKLCGQKGLLCGLFVSGILFLFITVISLILGAKLGVATAIHCLIMLLSGAIGGVLGVNMGKKIKI